MTDLKATFQAVADQLRAQEELLATREHEVADELAVAKEQTKVARGKLTELNVREKELDAREQAISNIENVQGEQARLEALLVELGKVRTENATKERELGEQRLAIQQREERVYARELAVSHKEETYKETVRKQFFEEVAKRLPR